MRSRITQRLLFALVIAAIFSVVPDSAFSQGRRRPSTAEERELAVRWTRALEADPLSKDADEMREKLFKWLIEVPDVSVHVCSDFLSPILGKVDSYAPELLTQQTFSSAAYLIENPGKKPSDADVHLAGLEGTLKAYEAILKSKPYARLAFMDGLIQKRSNGKLNDYVAEVMKTGCKIE